LLARHILRLPLLVAREALGPLAVKHALVLDERGTHRVLSLGRLARARVEVCLAPQEAKEGVEQRVDPSRLLRDLHVQSIESIVGHFRGEDGPVIVVDVVDVASRRVDDWTSPKPRQSTPCRWSKTPKLPALLRVNPP
jgi:hypothetical protein